MSKHTPRPWRIGTRNDGSRWFSLGDPIVGPHYQADIHCSDADARLIAAAPDLLEALKEIVQRNEIQHWFNLDQARAAIAKAEGEV